MYLITAACVGMFLISHYCRGQEHLGCYADDKTDRLLPTLGEVSDSNTVDTCIDICKRKGKTYAGVGLATECWCGDFHNFSRKGEVTEPNSEGKWCNYYCSGNKSQICGGYDHINVYSVCQRGSYRDPGGDVGNCDSECYCNARNICLYYTGQCPGGCQDGWYGTSCSFNGTYPVTTSRVKASLTTPCSTSTSTEEVSSKDAISSLETTTGNIMTSPAPTITHAATQVAGIASGTTVALLAVLVILGIVLVYFCRHRSRRRNSSSHIQPRGRMETTTEGVGGRMHQAIRVDTCVDKYDTMASSGANGKYAGATTDAVYCNTKAVTGVGGSDGYTNSQPKECLVDTANSTGVYEEPHGYMDMSTEPTYTPLNQSAVYQNVK